MVLYAFRAQEDDIDRSEPCKKPGSLSVCNSVLEHKTRKSREPFKRFSQNLVLCIFQAQEDDLDKSQLSKESGCLSVCMSVNTTIVYLENHSEDFHKI